MINEPLIQLVTILVRHDRDNVAVARLTDQRHQTIQLAVVLAFDVDTGTGSSCPDQLVKLIHAASPQILRLVSDLHNIRTEAGDLAEPYENLLAAITSCAHAQQQAAVRGDAVHDLKKRLQPCLIVGQIDHAADHPPRGCSRWDRMIGGRRPLDQLRNPAPAWPK